MRSFLLTVLLAVGIIGCGKRCYLKENETVQFYPSYVYQQPGRSEWNLVMQGQVVRPSEKSIFSESALKAVNTLSLLVPELGNRVMLLQERLRPFAVEGRPDKEVPVKLSGKTETLAKTGPDGYFEDQVTLPADQVAVGNAWFDFTTEACRNDERRFSGRALVIPEKGVSVISDIENTLQGGEGGGEQNLISRVFSDQPPVTGMSERYNVWAAQGAVFHYISSSPWQWMQTLNTFLTNQGFPEGVVHLRRVSLSESTKSVNAALEALAGLFRSSTVHKKPVIEGLLQRFPNRQFILVGSSTAGEPEVFADLARRYPQQVQKVYIRDIGGDSSTAKSWSTVFQGVPANRWKVFTRASDLS
jgi:phosphatidate phosphatase APP1